jgi:hypothetical protein
LLKICTRNGWTFEQWFQLSDIEKELRIAYEYKRVNDLNTLKENLITDDKLTVEALLQIINMSY